MATLAAAAALIVVIAVVVLNMVDNTGGKSTSRRTVPPDSAAGRAERAAQYLSGVPALRFSGSFASGGGTAQTDIWVTKAGSAVGTITLDGGTADLVIVDGETYVKAGEAFWRTHGGEPANAQDYADRWSRAPAKAFDLDIALTLAPGSIVQRLRSAATSTNAATVTSAPTEYVNSVPAIKVGTSRGDFYLSPATPFKLLRVAGTGTQNYQLDVTEPTAAQVTALFARLRQSVRKLAGSRDPSVKFVGGQLAFSNCNNNVSGCTLQLTATKVSTSTPTGDVRAVMLGKIVANGRTLGTCRGGQPVGAGRTVQLSCTVSSAGWRNWMREARSTPGTHRYNAEARVVAEALSVAEVNTLLKGIDQEQQGA